MAKVKSKLSVIILTVIMISILASAFRIQSARSSPSTITVPDDYPTIGAAIRAASPGDTVYVRSGTYNESGLWVITTLSLVGEDPLNTIIDGGGHYDVIEISASNVNVTGFTIRNSGSGLVDFAGIGLQGNILNEISYCNIYGNDITANTGYGVYLPIYCDHNSVFGNNITANSYSGIQIQSSSQNTIAENNIMANGGDGVSNVDDYESSVVGNNITANNWDGISLAGSSFSSVSQNNIEANHLDGVNLDSGCSNNTISGNAIANNGVGVEIVDSTNNTFYHNNFVDNTQQASSVLLANIWDDGYPSGGNYWSDYAGIDVKSGPNQDQPGSDGIGDTPYVINSNNIDHYPLMIPCGNYVTFTEAGLAQGTQWSVTFNDQTLPSASKSITFSETNGVYAFSITPLNGYTASQTSGIITVNGAEVAVPITFWNIDKNSYYIGNPSTDWDTGICYGLSSSALMYFMHYALAVSNYPCFPSQSPSASSTSDLDMSGLQTIPVIGWPFYQTLNNASLAVMFQQVYQQHSIGITLPGGISENEQYNDLVANLTYGNPVALFLGNAAPYPGAYYHAVVAVGTGPQMTNNVPTGKVEIYLYDPIWPKAIKVAVYDIAAGSFSYIVHDPTNPLVVDESYDSFYVVNPSDMLPTTVGNPLCKLFPKQDWWRSWLNETPTGYNIIIARAKVTIKATIDGNEFDDYFEGVGLGNSQTFVEEIPGSSGVVEGGVQVYAIPKRINFSVADPASGESTILITRVDNESEGLAGYGYLLDVASVQGDLNYTVTPAASGLSINVGNNTLNANVTFFYANEQNYSFSQASNIPVGALQTINFTVSNWQTLNDTGIQTTTTVPEFPDGAAGIMVTLLPILFVALTTVVRRWKIARLCEVYY